MRLRDKARWVNVILRAFEWLSVAFWSAASLARAAQVFCESFLLDLTPQRLLPASPKSDLRAALLDLMGWMKRLEEAMAKLAETLELLEAIPVRSERMRRETKLRLLVQHLGECLDCEEDLPGISAQLATATRNFLCRFAPHAALMEEGPFPAAMALPQAARAGFKALRAAEKGFQQSAVNLPLVLAALSRRSALSQEGKELQEAVEKASGIFEPDGLGQNEIADAFSDVDELHARVEELVAGPRKQA